VQVPLGRAIPRILEALGIQSFWINTTEEIGPVLKGAAGLTFASALPVAVLLPTTLTGGKRLKCPRRR